MTDTPVTKTVVQKLVRIYYHGPLNWLSLVGLIAVIIYGFRQFYLNVYNLRLVRDNFISFMGYYIIGFEYCVFSVSEAKHVFCRIRYTKHHADRIVAQPDKLISDRLIFLMIIASAVIFKACKSLFVYHQIAIAINLIVSHLLVAGTIAVLTFLLDIAYLQELSETSSDPVQNDLESKAGLNVVEQIAEKPLSVQIPPNTAMREPQLEVSVNTLVSQPVSSANSLRKISGCMV